MISLFGVSADEKWFLFIQFIFSFLKAATVLFSYLNFITFKSFPIKVWWSDQSINFWIFRLNSMSALVTHFNGYIFDQFIKRILHVPQIIGESWKNSNKQNGEWIFDLNFKIINKKILTSFSLYHSTMEVSISKLHSLPPKQ